MYHEEIKPNRKSDRLAKKNSIFDSIIEISSGSEEDFQFNKEETRNSSNLVLNIDSSHGVENRIIKTKRNNKIETEKEKEKMKKNLKNDSMQVQQIKKIVNEKKTCKEEECEKKKEKVKDKERKTEIEFEKEEESESEKGDDHTTEEEIKENIFLNENKMEMEIEKEVESDNENENEKEKEKDKDTNKHNEKEKETEKEHNQKKQSESDKEIEKEEGEENKQLANKRIRNRTRQEIVLNDEKPSQRKKKFIYDQKEDRWFLKNNTKHRNYFRSNIKKKHKNQNPNTGREKYSLEQCSSPSALSLVAQQGTKLAEYEAYIIMSDQNQFTEGGVSSCTINAIEASFRLLGRPKEITKGFIDEIIQIGSLYNSQTHTDFDTLHQNIPRFHNSLTEFKVEQRHVQEINTIVENLQIFSMITKNPMAAICTKPPETIALYCSPEENEYVVFDSHSRKLHKGAAFIYFITLEGMIRYIKELFPIIQLDFDNDYQELMLNSINVSYIHLKRGFVGTFKANKQELKKLLWEMRSFEKRDSNNRISHLKNRCDQFKELQKKYDELKNEIQVLKLENKDHDKNSKELKTEISNY
ncbi:hsp20-like chaperones superfamily protein [Anaeramoeba flamelloides]|uniref:Hsp20-like chaperones superfamily protein n=1 Tax=Anaeramoeba flamelloides TaxID=1746091 RepID=A0AAV8A4B0_9EUKA|nr:hsp20-like chaperones superfamily protein [Anaeramoeba flamelloides]